MKQRIISLIAVIAVLSAMLSGCRFSETTSYPDGEASESRAESTAEGSQAGEEISEPDNSNDPDNPDNNETKKAVDDPKRISGFLEANGNAAVSDFSSVPGYARKTDVPFLYKLPYELPGGGIYSIFPNRDRILLSYSNEIECRSLIYSFESGELIAADDTYDCYNKGILADGRFWSFDTVSSTLYFYDKSGNEKTVWHYDSPDPPMPSAVCVTENGKYLALSYDGIVNGVPFSHVYNLETGEKSVIDSEVYFWNIYQHDNAFILLSINNHICFYDPESGETVIKKSTMSPNGVYGGLYSAYVDSGIYLGSVHSDEFYYADLGNYEYTDSVYCGISLNIEYGEQVLFRLYDLLKGEQLAEFKLPGVERSYAAKFSPNGGLFICESDEASADLYWFDIKGASEAASGKKLNAIVATESELDETTAEIVARLEEDLEIDILYASEGNDFVIYDYVGVAELDSFTIYKSIKTVDGILRRYPKGMLKETYSETNGGLKIYLCADIYGVMGSSLSTAGGVTTEIKDDIVIALDVGSNLKFDLPHELSHAFDRRISYVSGKEDAPTDWMTEWENATTVKGGYLYSYSNYLNNERYTLGYENSPSKVWFVDGYARTFPTEDRARIMENLFNCSDLPLDEWKECPHLIEKAELYCKILRECFPSCKNSDTLPWESFFEE